MQSDLIWLVTQKDFDIPEKNIFNTVTCIMHRWNLYPISNVSEAALISLFWAANKLNKLPEMLFKFPFNQQIDKSTMAFLTGQSWCVLKSCCTGGGLEQRFWSHFTDGLNPKFSSVCGTGYLTLSLKGFILPFPNPHECIRTFLLKLYQTMPAKQVFLYKCSTRIRKHWPSVLSGTPCRHALKILQTFQYQQNLLCQSFQIIFILLAFYSLIRCWDKHFL